jgi:hypothetical protein
MTHFRRGYSLLALVLTLLTPLVPASKAAAFSGSAAANYAETWWNARNGAYMALDNDCTNFVSQALNNGGFSIMNVGGSVTDDHNWFLTKTLWAIFNYSHS